MTDYDTTWLRADEPHGAAALDSASSLAGRPDRRHVKPLPHPAIILDDSPQLRKVIEELEAGTYPQPEYAIWRDDLPEHVAIRLARATGATDDQIAAVRAEPDTTPGETDAARARTNPSADAHHGHPDRGGRAADPPRDSIAPPEAQGSWRPVYQPWRHGGWYVTNVRYPGGATGCVSRNYPDRKWRIVCDSRPDAHEKHTFRTRDDAARAERELAAARWQRVAELAAGLAPVTGPGTAPNTTDTPCAACGTVVKAGRGSEIPGIDTGPAVLDSTCSDAIGREQADLGGAGAAPDGYAGLAGQAHRRPPEAVAAESFPYGAAASLRPADGTAAPSGQSAHSTARRQPDQSPRAASGRGRR